LAIALRVYDELVYDSSQKRKRRRKLRDNISLLLDGTELALWREPFFSM
jgi:hypothetical protein